MLMQPPGRQIIFNIVDDSTINIVVILLLFFALGRYIHEEFKN